MNEILGNRIRTLRTAKQYTQEQIAEKIGISRQKYARIENGTNSITLDILSKIANILDVSVSDITKILDEVENVEYRTLDKENTSKKIFDMLDLFYANKHMWTKLKQKDTH